MVQELELRQLLAADFGDAPAPYPVTLAEDGARHQAVGPQFGDLRTTEADGVHSALADADAGEDSIYFGEVPLYAGVHNAKAFVSVRNVIHSAWVDAWIDFNADGDWTDAGEQIATSVNVNVGQSEIRFDIPQDAVVGQTFARFRVSSAGGLTSTGEAPDGEVEDYPVEILFGAPTPDGLSGVDQATLVVNGTTRPTITWQAVPGADRYELHFQKRLGGPFATGNTIERAIVNTTSCSPDFDLALGSGTRLWMRSISATGDNSVWSREFRVFINSGVATSFQPIDKSQLTARPTLTWNSMVGATQYDLWVSNVTTGTSQVIRETIYQQTLAPVTFTPVADLPIGQYRAWVRVGSSSGGLYDWSVPVDFCVVTPPVPAVGPNSTFDRTPELAWQPVNGAVSYEIRLVSRNTGTVVHNPTSLTTTSWTPPTDLTDGPYHWQVIAVGANGFRTWWSDARDIYIGGRNQLTSPQEGNTIPRLATFSWTAVDGAAYYELLGLEYRYNGVTDRVESYTRLDESNLTGTSATVIISHSIGQTWQLYVWVRAISSSGEIGPWSQTPLIVNVFQE